jgi:hypothetical protein
MKISKKLAAMVGIIVLAISLLVLPMNADARFRSSHHSGGHGGHGGHHGGYGGHHHGR